MKNIIGEIEVVKTSLVSGEVTSDLIRNTTTGMMLVRAAVDTNTTVMNNMSIYITDADFAFTKQMTMSVNIASYLRTFQLKGSIIQGEFWPQLYDDAEQKRYVITVKNRFTAPASGDRSIKMIYLASGDNVMAGVNLPTPCVQTPNDLLDVYYRIYVNYGDAPVNNPNYNINMMRASGIINKFFITNSTTYGAYKPGTSEWATTNPGYAVSEAALPYTPNLNYIPNTGSASTGYSNSDLDSKASSTRNYNQASYQIQYNLGVNDAIGSLVQSVGSAMTTSSNSSWTTADRLVNINKILPEGSSLIQSVYSRAAASKTTNLAYLDASAISAATAKINMNTNNFGGEKTIPQMFRIITTKAGGKDVAEFNVETRTTLGFANNLFSKENRILLRNVFKSYPYKEKFVYENASMGDTGLKFSTYAHLVGCSDGKHILSFADDGVTRVNVWTQDFKSWGARGLPTIALSGIVDVTEGPDKNIYVASTTLGLLRINPATDDIHYFTGISGVTETTCYSVDVKDNGDIWAAFAGGLAKYNGTTWTVYNESSAVKFNNPLLTVNWSNCRGIKVRKDGAADKLCVLTNSNTVIWFQPGVNETGVNVNNLINSFPVTVTNRAANKKQFVNIPLSDRWGFKNSSNYSLCDFGSTAFVNTPIRHDESNLSYLSRILVDARLVDGVYRFITVDCSDGNDESRIVIFNPDNTVYADTTKRNDLNIFHGFPSVMIDDNLNILINSSDYDGKEYAGPSIANAGAWFAPTWTKWGWDSATSKWVKNGTGSRKVSDAGIVLPNGANVSWDADNSAGAFVLGDFWLGYMMDGLHKDNSTSAKFGYVRNGRDSYTTSDLSANTITAAGSQRTVSLNFVTNIGTFDNILFSFRGGTAASSLSNYVQMTSQPALTDMPYAEYLPVGDFTLEFKGVPGSRIASDSSSGNGRIGITKNRSAGWDIGFNFRDGKYYVYKWVGNSITGVTTLAPYPNKDSVFSIQRSGNNVLFKVDGDTVYTETNYGSDKVSIVSGFYNEDVMTFRDAKLTYIESRPNVQIGNVANTTGVYDPRFAMVEGWATSPRTAKITIGGQPANVHVDPEVTLGTGDVLLLQKSGTLIFSNADIGKAITSDVVILNDL